MFLRCEWEVDSCMLDKMQRKQELNLALKILLF